MINTWITELIMYGIKQGLIEAEDKVYVTNKVLELFRLNEYEEKNDVIPRAIDAILNDLLNYAEKQGILADASVTEKDLFDTRIMGLITPAPSTVRRIFLEKYKKSPREATDFYYDFSKATNYIREDRIAKDEKWTVKSDYGDIDITINLSKPEKDPKEIEKAGRAKASGYPKCLLCKENEGFAGHLLHPARQNHRIIPIRLESEDYYLQYSPYVYYNEHCIVFNGKHVPMTITKDTLAKLLDFIGIFPHYTIGSNADLPIVGGSILSHDHFQGGRYTFAMEMAPVEYEFKLDGFDNIRAGVVKWPMSVIRLQCAKSVELVEAADSILRCWKNYSDEDAFIFSETNGVPHNTITPIARMRHGLYELDLVLRNNITTEENPWGVFHPAEKYHHIKKENIGLIEVMGLAVLPARLKKEMLLLEQTILTKQDIRMVEELKKHANWACEWMKNYEITPENIHAVVQQEIGKVFVKVLECAGVFKRNKEGKEAFGRFLKELNK